MRAAAASRFAAPVVAAIIATPSFAQTSPLPQIEVQMGLDSGVVTATAESRATAWSDVLVVPGAPWLRLRFDEATLGPVPAGGQPTLLRITSLADGAVQNLSIVHLQQWQNTSAYFNGEALLIEIIADANAGPSHVQITSVWAGIAGNEESICGTVDDRELSEDHRQGRIWPVGCTGFIINDANHCFLTAGHCDGGMDVVQFNVPLSSAGGTPQHPGPEDQYPVDPESVQSNGGQGVGSDWAYFGCFPNSETDLTAYEATGVTYELEQLLPTAAGQEIRITGYGVTSPPVPGSWNLVQKTHSGPFVLFDDTALGYETDTTGGNSGSAVLNEDTGRVIGIHTHGGCNSFGSNFGTALNHSDLQFALANPQGVCMASGCSLASAEFDQAQEEIDTGFAVSESAHHWQEFTPTSPTLLSVRVFLLTNFPPFEAIEADIWVTDPLGQTVWSDEFDFDGYWTDWVCLDTGNLNVQPYQTYRLNVGGTGALWLGSTASTYPDFSSVDPGPEAGELDGFDFTFQTQGDGTVVPPCPWDINGDGDVNTPDLVQIIVDWGPCNNCAADFDDSGTVDVSDLLDLILNWGPCE